jgi:hypothetical protein
MPRRNSKEVASLMHRALGYSNGDQKLAARMLFDAGMGIVTASDDAIREWASCLLWNYAAEASPHDCSEIVGESEPVH